jgi:predicted anti-sigma-YlaC factor YlaD
MSCEEYEKLVSSYLDGELSAEQKERFEEHLRICSHCKQELLKFKKLKEVTEKMKFVEPPEKAWGRYWTGVYNRLERGTGWILTSIGAIILLFYGVWRWLQSLIRDFHLALMVKIGILVLAGGLIILLISVIREKVFTYKKERYKEVVR